MWCEVIYCIYSYNTLYGNISDIGGNGEWTKVFERPSSRGALALGLVAVYIYSCNTVIYGYEIMYTVTYCRVRGAE